MKTIDSLLTHTISAIRARHGVVAGRRAWACTVAHDDGEQAHLDRGELLKALGAIAHAVGIYHEPDDGPCNVRDDARDAAPVTTAAAPRSGPGLCRRYEVKRLNDSEGKHADCEYFVLDWEHDPFSVPAALAYAAACEATHPELAKDLRYLACAAETRVAISRPGDDPEDEDASEKLATEKSARTVAERERDDKQAVTNSWSWLIPGICDVERERDEALASLARYEAPGPVELTIGDVQREIAARDGYEGKQLALLVGAACAQSQHARDVAIVESLDDEALGRVVLEAFIVDSIAPIDSGLDESSSYWTTNSTSAARDVRAAILRALKGRHD